MRPIDERIGRFLASKKPERLTQEIMLLKEALKEFERLKVKARLRQCRTCGREAE